MTPHHPHTPGDVASGMPLEGVAIVGMSGRFPGARDVSQFWKNIQGGVNSISHFTPEELDIPLPQASMDEFTSVFVRAKGILDDIDQFDARFFGYLPREVELMDPQQRVFLEICWEAMEHAGYDAQRYTGAVGVYAGCYIDTYLLWNLCSNPEFLAKLVDSIQVGSLQTELGNDKDYLATRVAYKLGLRGPAMTVQSACSTSLVAIATACQSLEAYSCDMALAGGVTIVLPQKKGYFYKEGGMLSPDGTCRTFDENAAGTVFSNGAAVVLLKRVADAVADGDTIYGVIRGYATNNDGGQKVSYTAPSVEGQAEVIALAMGMAGIDPRSIGYIEAHGTATPLGDPIEIAGLTTAFRTGTPDTGYCAIGSVKANLGHLDCASGAIGLIKTALALHDKVLPPMINFTKPNPKLNLESSPFYVNTELKAWPAGAWPRRAGVSSFGVGGTNAHVVVEEGPEVATDAASSTHQLLVLSARTEAALAAQAARLADHLEVNPPLALADAAHTLQVGRREFEQRRIVVADSAASAVTKLRGKAAPRDAGRPLTSKPPVVFVFPGQGAQYPGMGAELYHTQPVFRAVIDRVAVALRDERELGLDLRTYLLWNETGQAMPREQAQHELAQTRLSQPAIFAIEIALAHLLASLGIKPAAVIGHSVGEFAGACLAGIFELEDAARLVAARGRLMQALPPGKMLAVRAPMAEVAPVLTPPVCIAAVNAPAVTVVSGPSAAIDALAAQLEAAGVSATALVTSHAFHSAMMEPARSPLVARVAATQRHAAQLPIYSTSTGALAGAGALNEPEYWGHQLMSPVRFGDAAAAAMAADPYTMFLEVGPGHNLSSLLRTILPPPSQFAAVPCLGPLQAPGSETEHLLTAIGRLWMAGVTADWAALAGGRRQRVALPTYPFERKRFWVEPSKLSFVSRGDADAATPPPVPSPLPVAANDTGGNAATAAPAAQTYEQPGLAANGDVEALIRAQLAIVAAQLKVLGAQ